MQHSIELSNGQEVLLIEEGDKVTIATAENGEPDAYLCQITMDGILVYGNSDNAGFEMLMNLGIRKEKPVTLFQSVKLTVDIASETGIGVADDEHVLQVEFTGDPDDCEWNEAKNVRVNLPLGAAKYLIKALKAATVIFDNLDSDREGSEE